MELSVLSTYFLSRSSTRFLTAGCVAIEIRSGFTTATTADIITSNKSIQTYLEIYYIKDPLPYLDIVCCLTNSSAFLATSFCFSLSTGLEDPDLWGLR